MGRSRSYSDQEQCSTHLPAARPIPSPQPRQRCTTPSLHTSLQISPAEHIWPWESHARQQTRQSNIELQQPATSFSKRQPDYFLCSCSLSEVCRDQSSGGDSIWAALTNAVRASPISIKSRRPSSAVARLGCPVTPFLLVCGTTYVKTFPRSGPDHLQSSLSAHSAAQEKASAPSPLDWHENPPHHR